MDQSLVLAGSGRPQTLGTSHGLHRLCFKRSQLLWRLHVLELLHVGIQQCLRWLLLSQLVGSPQQVRWLLFVCLGLPHHLPVVIVLEVVDHLLLFLSLFHAWLAPVTVPFVLRVTLGFHLFHNDDPFLSRGVLLILPRLRLLFVDYFFGHFLMLFSRVDWKSLSVGPTEVL